MYRARDLVVAHVVAWMAAMSKNGGGDLGEVHVAAAAQADDRVRTKLVRCFNARFRGLQGRLRLAAGKDLDDDLAFRQGSAHALGHAGLHQVTIRNEEDALGSKSIRNSAQLADRVAAEDDLAGGVERPGFAHVNSSPSSDAGFLTDGQGG